MAIGIFIGVLLEMQKSTIIPSIIYWLTAMTLYWDIPMTSRWDIRMDEVAI